MHQYCRVVAETVENGDNIGNNSGVVNGEFGGTGDDVGTSTDDLEESNWRSSIGTTVWAEHSEEDVDNIDWYNNYNWFEIEHYYTVSDLPMYDDVVTTMKALIESDQPRYWRVPEVNMQYLNM